MHYAGGFSCPTGIKRAMIDNVYIVSVYYIIYIYFAYNMHHLSLVSYYFFSVFRRDTRSVVPTQTMFYTIVFSRYLY